LNENKTITAYFLGDKKPGIYVQPQIIKCYIGPPDENPEFLSSTDTPPALLNQDDAIERSSKPKNQTAMDEILNSASANMLQLSGETDTLSNFFEGPYFSYTEDYQTHYEATRLVPKKTCTLNTVFTAFINNNTSRQSKDVEFFVWEDNFGKPGKIIYYLDTSISLDADKSSWIYYHPADTTIYLNGPFWVGHREKIVGWPTSIMDSVATKNMNYHRSNNDSWASIDWDFLQFAVVIYRDDLSDYEAVVPVTIKNTGQATLTVSNITCTDTWIVDISVKNFNLESGQQKQFEVRLAAENLPSGDYRSKLVIHSNVENLSEYNIPIFLKVIKPTFVDKLQTSEAGNPTDFVLFQNYPNPFNPRTTIPFYLPQASQVTLHVYNLAGEMVAELFNGYETAGKHYVVWNVEKSPSGTYFIKLQTKDIVQLKKSVLLK